MIFLDSSEFTTSPQKGNGERQGARGSWKGYSRYPSSRGLTDNAVFLTGSTWTNPLTNQGAFLYLIRSLNLKKGYFISLLKYKNGLLIRIIHNGLEDSLDHIQIRIHDQKRFFTSMDPKWVNIARLAAVTRNTFNTYISCLTTPLIFTAILYPRRGLSDRLCPFYQDGKIVIQTGPALL